MSRNLSSGQFPTMGESAVTSVEYTRPERGKLVPRNLGGESAEARTAVVRTQYHAVHGYTGGIKATRDFHNAPEASATGRKVRPIGAARGGQAQFDARRSFGQGA